MNKEIERKFLVLNNDFIKEAESSSKIVQGYLSKDPRRTVRIRIKDEKAFITVKGISVNKGTERFEYEKEINKQDALQLLDLCLPDIIKKTRYYIPAGKHIFEVDVFEGKYKGLIIAEIELENADENFIKPNWLGREVTGNKKYYNSELSKNTDIIPEITKRMISYFGNDVRRINHALKVFTYAQTIGKLENISFEDRQTTEICGLLHDIGIKICEKKYGSTAGKYQEIESPVVAKNILSDFNIPEKIKDRILFIIANHHSYNKIDGIDFQILVEADFLVNFEEGNEPENILSDVKKNIFKTKTSLILIENIFA